MDTMELNDFGAEPHISSASVLQKIAHANGCNKHGKAGRLPKRLICHALDGNAQQRAHHHSNKHANYRRQQKGCIIQVNTR